MFRGSLGGQQSLGGQHRSINPNVLDLHAKKRLPAQSKKVHAKLETSEKAFYTSKFFGCAYDAKVEWSIEWRSQKPFLEHHLSNYNSNTSFLWSSVVINETAGKKEFKNIWLMEFSGILVNETLSFSRTSNLLGKPAAHSWNFVVFKEPTVEISFCVCIAYSTPFKLKYLSSSVDWFFRKVVNKKD